MAKTSGKKKFGFTKHAKFQNSKAFDKAIEDCLNDCLEYCNRLIIGVKV